MTKLKYFWTKIRYCLHINQGFANTTPQTLACPIFTVKVRNGFEKGSLTGMILIDL